MKFLGTSNHGWMYSFTNDDLSDIISMIEDEWPENSVTEKGIKILKEFKERIKIE